MSFFEKRAKSPTGNFFADQRGKKDGMFNKCAEDESVGDGQPEDDGAATPPTEMAAVPTPNPGQGASAGDLYGTGKGIKPLGKKKPPAAMKVASSDPTDPDFVAPQGFHRPTADQPEPLEAGAERFMSTDAPGADFGTGKGIQHRGGVNEGGTFSSKVGGGAQMGKHASPGVTDGEFWKERASDASKSVRSGAGEIGGMASDAISSATSSPLLMTLGAGLLARKGVKAGAGAIKKVREGRAAAKAAKGVGEVAKGVGVAEKVSAGARKIQSFLRR